MMGYMSLCDPEFSFLLFDDIDLAWYATQATSSPISSDGDPLPCCPTPALPSSTLNYTVDLEQDKVPWGEYIVPGYMDTEQESDKEQWDDTVVDPKDLCLTQGAAGVSCSAIEPQLAITKQCSSAQTSKKTRRPRRCRKNAEPHLCETCHEKFPRPRDLRRHIKRHNRPLRCQQCPAAAAERRDLDRHYWASHPLFARVLGLRPPEPSDCRVCGKSFTRKDNLIRHMRKYHGYGQQKKEG